MAVRGECRNEELVGGWKIENIAGRKKAEQKIEKIEKIEEKQRKNQDNQT
ncbi:MAG: hypothetical protein GF381_03555 [Candidatus Pacebacteria bacterium]|nr:hypothetical protein [Candidatus Paceibacterota bacterium]